MALDYTTKSGDTWDLIALNVYGSELKADWLMQNIRNHFGKAVTITSAYRTAAHNKAVKGATYSQHCYGMAADIRIQGVDVETLATYAETLLKNTGGIGRYPVKTGRPAGWVHIDTRAVKSRWVG